MYVSVHVFVDVRVFACERACARVCECVTHFLVCVRCRGHARTYVPTSEASVDSDVSGTTRNMLYRHMRWGGQARVGRERGAFPRPGYYY